MLSPENASSFCIFEGILFISTVPRDVNFESLVRVMGEMVMEVHLSFIMLRMIFTSLTVYWIVKFTYANISLLGHFAVYYYAYFYIVCPFHIPQGNLYIFGGMNHPYMDLQHTNKKREKLLEVTSSIYARFKEEIMGDFQEQSTKRRFL